MPDRNDKHNITGGVFAPSSDSFQVGSASAIIDFATEEVNPPAAEYIGVDDSLWVQTVGLFGGNTIQINVRILRADGVIVPISLQHKIGGGRVADNQVFPLLEGWLLSVSFSCTTGVIPRNAVYANVALVRPPNTNLAQYRTLFAGYITSQFTQGWPESIPQRETDGPGYPDIAGNFAVGAPAAGADFVYTVPGSIRVRITSLSALLTTAVAAANRLPSIIIDDGANVVAMIPSGNTQAASLAEQYTWADSCPQAALFDNKVIAPLPSNLILKAGWRVRSNTTAIQAADQWSAVFILGQQWSEQG